MELTLLTSLIEAHLFKVEELLPPDYVLTFLARNKNKNYADIILTKDNTASAMEALSKLFKAKDSTSCAKNSIDSKKFARLVKYIDLNRNSLTGEVSIPDVAWRKLRSGA